jgi:hypothetical protein
MPKITNNNYIGQSHTSLELDTITSKYGIALKLRGGTGSESYIRPTASVAYKSGHKYYTRAEIYQTSQHGSSDFYLILAEPNWYSGKTIS